MAATSIHSISSTQVRALAYIVNDGKTEHGSLVSCYGCSVDPDEACKDFERVQNAFGGRGRIQAKHMIVSFKPDEITPEKAFEIGKELADRMLKGEYQYMLAVHTDRRHIHCHIVFNNTNMVNGKTFGYCEDRKRDPAWKKLRRLSDELCRDNRLSVIKDSDKTKGRSYYEWNVNREGLSWKSKLKFALDDCIMKSENFEDFLNKVREKNIEVEYNPEHKIDLKFRMAEQERWTRARTLGWYYETPQIKKRIEQVKVLTSGRAFSHKRSRLIDTSQDKFQAAKGLERWAEIQNMKEASKVINTLTAHGVNSVDEIKQTALAEFGRRMELMKELNSMQQQIETLSEVIVNVRRVKKYQPIVDEFKMQKNDRSKKKYSSQHSEELEKYKGATAFLKEKYPDGKCPSEKSLTEKRKELIELRAARNDEYKQLSDKLKDLDYARRTIEEYLGKSHSQKRDELE